MTEEQKKKIEEISNSYDKWGGLIPCLLEVDIEITIYLAKEVFNKDITEEEAKRILGYDDKLIFLYYQPSVPIVTMAKYAFLAKAYMLDTYFNEIKNNSIKD